MPTDDKTTNPASERVEAISVEVLGALPSGGLQRSVFGRVPTPLVSATVVMAPEAQRDAEPEAGAHPVLEVGEPSGNGRGGSEKLSPSTRTSARTHSGPHFGTQGGEEAGPTAFSPPTGKKALPLG